MRKREALTWLMEEGRDLCVACVLVPAVAFIVGLAAVSFPLQVGGAGLVAALVCVAMFYRAMGDQTLKHLHGRIALVSSMVSISVLSGLGCGLMAAGPAQSIYGLGMMLSFSFGLAGGITYRKHRRELGRQALGAAS